MTTPLLIRANDAEGMRTFLVKHLRDQASMRRRMSALARIKTDERSHARLAGELDMIADQLDRAAIMSTGPGALLETIDKADYITVTLLGSGYAAVHMTHVASNDGLNNSYWDVQQTGVGRFASPVLAEREARQWSESDKIKLRLNNPKPE